MSSSSSSLRRSMTSGFLSAAVTGGAPAEANVERERSSWARSDRASVPERVVKAEAGRAAADEASARMSVCSTSVVRRPG